MREIVRYFLDHFNAGFVVVVAVLLMMALIALSIKANTAEFHSACLKSGGVPVYDGRQRQCIYMGGKAP